MLGEDEYVVIHTRTHVKALLLPVFAFLVIGAAVGAGVALVPGTWQPVGPLVVAGIGLVLFLWMVLAPWLRWWTTTYTITNQRLITRAGILNKVGKDLPLNRVHEVSYQRSLIDRLLGCGTLNVQTAAEDGSMVLSDVPDVERVHATMTELLLADHRVSSRGGPRP